MSCGEHMFEAGSCQGQTNLNYLAGPDHAVPIETLGNLVADKFDAVAGDFVPSLGHKVGGRHPVADKNPCM